MHFHHFKFPFRYPTHVEERLTCFNRKEMSKSPYFSVFKTQNVSSTASENDPNASGGIKEPNTFAPRCNEAGILCVQACAARKRSKRHRDDSSNECASSAPSHSEMGRSSLPTPLRERAVDDSTELVPTGTFFCCFDTESSGLGETARVVQMALGFFASDGRPLRFYNKLWKLPKGVRMSPASQKIHKISHSRIETLGVQPKAQLVHLEEVFARLRSKGIRVVAFNKKFDVRLLAQTARLEGVKWTLQTDHVLCTMTESRVHCPLRTLEGNKKGFTNSELYVHFFGRVPSDVPLHDAEADIRITASTYLMGRHKSWWS